MNLKLQGQNHYQIFCNFFLSEGKIRRCIFRDFALQVADHLLQLYYKTHEMYIVELDDAL